MSECANGELRDLLPELVNGQLDAEMQATVEAHVASCTECADELALLRSLRPALLHVTAIDTDRIAAAVRAQLAGASGVPTRRRIAPRWRIAIAAAALLATGALGYAVVTLRSPGTQAVAVVHPAPVETRDTASRALPAPHAAPAQLPQRIAVASPHVAAPATASTNVASAAVLDNLADLSDEDVQTLTASLDKLSSIPDADPAPGIDPLGASLEDGSAGGR